MRMKFFQGGFTLVELIVVIGILAILFAGTLLALNPFTQFEKARDAKRQEEMQSIKSALDSYYNDHGCYPASITFGIPWTEGQTTYLKQIPQDQECSGGGICYAYQTDNSSCPQWNALYAKLRALPSGQNKCVLTTLTSCLPTNFNSLGYNYCSLSGNPDCTYLTSSTIISSAFVTITPTSPPTPTITPTPIPPTPTFTPVPTQACSPRIFKCVNHSCNNVGGNSGDFCGYPGCSGNQCCSNSCF